MSRPRDRGIAGSGFDIPPVLIIPCSPRHCVGAHAKDGSYVVNWTACENAHSHYGPECGNFATILSSGLQP